MRRFGRLVIIVATIATMLGLCPAVARTRERRPVQGASRDAPGHQWRAATDSRCPACTSIGTLSQIARRHSLKMAQEQSLFHTTNPSSVYLKGISWHYWGENVGVTGGTVADLESAFMASLPHRQNILNKTFRHVAIGAVRVDGRRCG